MSHRRLTTHFHAVSDAVKESTVATLGIDPARVSVVKRGRDPERLGAPSPERRAASRRHLGVPDDAELVVTVGRQEYQKGHRHLIEAFAAVVALRPSAQLLVVGREGHSSAELKLLVSQLGLGDAVTFLGHRDDVAEVLAAADVFVFPSLYEGLGGALIEAMGLGLPVVASDIPALREVVTPGLNADLVPVGDVGALAQTLAELLADRSRMRRYGAASSARFADEFTLSAATDRLIDLLAEVASGAATPAAPAPALPTEPGDVISAMRDRRGLIADDATWTEVRSWDSFKATFAELERHDGQAIAVKFGTNWSDDDPAFVCDETRRVRGLLEALPDGPVVMPDALGWCQRPPAVAMELTPGEGLFDLLGGGRAGAPGRDDLVTMVRRSGQALGAFHAAQPGTAVDGGGAAREEFVGAARRSLAPKSAANRLSERVPRARGYRFSPNDFIVTAEGRLVMLDPPHVRKVDHVVRDISAFTFEIHRHVIGERPARLASGSRRKSAASLRRAFLDGYRTTGLTQVDDPVDQWALRVYETSRVSGHLYGKLRGRTVRGMLGTAVWFAASRLRLGRAPD